MNKRADILILGNVITMDVNKPYAEAVAIQGERIIYVGAREVAKKLCTENTKIYDYGNNSIYPGFLDAHCHPGGAGYQMNGLAHLDREASLEECIRVMKEYMDSHPGKDIYSGQGFQVQEIQPHARMLDAICPDKLMCLTDVSGHSMWINSLAMKQFGIDKEAVKRWGDAQVKVDENGEPTGYISEAPVFHVRAQIKLSLEDMKDAVLTWQSFALSKGYTGAYNAGVNLVSMMEPEAWLALDKENKLKIYNFGGYMLGDNTDTPEEDIEFIEKEMARLNSKHNRIIGAKVFCDGIVEGRTAWMLEDYEGQPGYKGVARFDDHEKMVRLIVAASNHHMNVHVHTIGDAAIRAWIDAFAEAEEETGNFDQRNAMAHLQCAHPEDVRRIAEYNIMAVDGMMWREKTLCDYVIPLENIGEKRGNATYPLKNYMDNGALLVSHSDFPVSPYFDVTFAFCIGANGYVPSEGIEMKRDDGQNLSRFDTLKALTINVAYTWHEENNMGSLEVGKLANIAVFEKDFLKDSFEEIEKARCLATFVDGELVYSIE
ncbi:MAG: amidohydrolase [Bacilli bacterium]|nr:amidohydrolase [Bacilli bacterium]